MPDEVKHAIILQLRDDGPQEWDAYTESISSDFPYNDRSARGILGEQCLDILRRDFESAAWDTGEIERLNAQLTHAVSHQGAAKRLEFAVAENFLRQVNAVRGNLPSDFR